MVEVRPKDQKAITTLVNIGGTMVAEIQLTEVNDTVKLRGDRTDWKARVAGGVDLAFVSTMFCCIYNMLSLWLRSWLSCSVELRCSMFGESKILTKF
jgi:hypothetical protein